MKECKLKIEGVSVLIGSSIQTINNWYRWKKENPNHELAKLLPEYTQQGARQTRFWQYSDIEKLREFKMRIPHGRLGILGTTTHRRK